MSEKGKASEKEQKIIKVLYEPIATTSVKSGDLVYHDALGKGIVVGFSSVSNNPDIFFYDEQRIICVDFSQITKT